MEEGKEWLVEKTLLLYSLRRQDFELRERGAVDGGKALEAFHVPAFLLCAYYLAPQMYAEPGLRDRRAVLFA